MIRITKPWTRDLSEAPASRFFVLDPEPDAGHRLPWSGPRHLLAALRDRLDDVQIMRAVQPLRGPLSLVLRGLTGSLSPDEQLTRQQHDGTWLAWLPEPIISPGPLAEAWAGLLTPLLEQVPGALEIVVTHHSHLDLNSLLVVRLLQRDLGDRLHVAIGDDPAFVPDDLHWCAAVQANREWLASLEGEPERSEPGRAPVAPRLVDALDDDLERRAWQALERPDPDVDLPLTAARAALGAHGFSTAAALAELALQRCASPTPGQRAELHALAGVAAYNLPRPRLASPGPDRAHEHFEQALELETNPHRRSALLHRLAVHRAHAGEQDRALAYADESIAAATELGPTDFAALLEAWGHNCRGLPLFRTGRIEEATAECERAYEIIASVEPSPSLTRAFAMSRFHVANNLARVRYLVGEVEPAKAWQRRSDHARDEIPAVWAQNATFVCMRLVDDDLAGAVRRCRRHLDEARHHCFAWREALWSRALAELLLRQGDPSAYRHAARSLALLRRMHELPEEVLGEEMNCAIHALAGGHLTEAAEHLDALIADPRTGGGSDGELAALRSLVAARRGEAEDHRRYADAAEQVLATLDDAGAVARIVRALAAAQRALGAPERARPLLQRGLALETADAMPPEDAFGLRVEQLLGGDRDVEHLARALELGPAALEQPERWADIAPLLEAVRAAGDGSLIERHRPHLERVLACGRQRADARAAAAALDQALGRGRPA